MKKYYHIYFDGVITQITTNTQGKNIWMAPISSWRSLASAKKECARMLKKVKKEVEGCEIKMQKLTESDV
jgi:hypothetical protein